MGEGQEFQSWENANLHDSHILLSGTVLVEMNRLGGGGYDKLTCTQISDDVMPSEVV